MVDATRLHDVGYVKAAWPRTLDVILNLFDGGSVLCRRCAQLSKRGSTLSPPSEPARHLEIHL